MQEHHPTSPTNVSLANLSEAKRDLLQKFLLGDLHNGLNSPRTITRRSPDSQPQLSFAQERLWFLDQLMPGSAVFNVPIAVRLSTPLDLHALELSVNEIVRRHEVLRTTFASVDGQPSPIVSPDLHLALSVTDLITFVPEEREAEARRLVNEEAQRPFDLGNGPLVRTSLIRLDDQAHIFLVTMHHIISDGWSIVVFFEELSRLYEAFAKGEGSPLDPLPIQYADYAAWQKGWLQGEVLEQQLAYWKQNLGGDLPVLELPTDRPRPAVQTYHGARESLALSTKLTAAIETFSQREGATLFMTLLAAFKVLLYRYTGQEDIIVGSPIANRPQTETEKLIGFFLNNLALRTKLTGTQNFREVLARVRKTALEAYAHQDLPFEKLIEELKPERDLSRTAFFQVYFNLFNFNDEVKLPGSTKSVSFFEAWLAGDENLSKFDLTLYAGLHDGTLKLALVYNVDLFDSATIRQMLAHFEMLLEGIVANPQTLIADYALRSPESFAGNRVGPKNEFTLFEKHEIEQSISQRFEQQVRKYPKRIAVKSGNHQWSYEELNRAANQVAHTILSLRGLSEERIALLFEHDAPMIAGMLGTLKAGKTYVPLDPSYPTNRLASIIENSQAGVILTNDRNLVSAQALGAALQIINVDRLESATPVSDIDITVDPNTLAYLLYTSGSTGQPKGVMQNHRNVLHFIRAYTNNLHINADDRLTLLSSYSFDASVMDVYGALLNGATLYPIDIKEDGLIALSEWLNTEKITIYHSTPTVYRTFLNSLNGRGRFCNLRLVVLGGEEVTRQDVELYRKYFSNECLFVNGLGPTEATVSLQYFIDRQTATSGAVPVGYPVEDTEILLLNAAGQPTEIFGEIAIRSEHVALGYWRNAEATAAAFCESPAPGCRTYRTGDLGRRLPDGSMVFEGRKDSQIKIRGFRVELGEIEAALAEHPSVEENAVVAIDDQFGEKRLVAYIVADESPTTEDLRAYLKNKLPEYMTPAVFIRLESLPLTSSGKVNRRALPTPDDFNSAPVATIARPQTQMEILLTNIWADLLGIKQVGVNDNFFALGGHSLLAVRLFALIEKRFGRRLPLATLFLAPTVAELAVVLQKDLTPTWSSLVPIQPSGSRPPFFCVHALGGNVLEYHALAKHLDSNQPFYGLQSQGLNENRSPHTCIEDMAAHYLSEIREVQPKGPYFIGGRSLGGMIAFEMARQLRVQGEAIGLLALLDTYPAGYAKHLRDSETFRGRLARLARRTQCHISNLRALSINEKLFYVLEKARYVPRRIKSYLWRKIYRSYRSLGRPLPNAFRQVREFNSMAARDYQPQAYEGSVTLFWASEDLRASYDLVEGWRELAAGGIELHEVPGSHLNIIEEPHVGTLAEKLSACLKRAQAQT